MTQRLTFKEELWHGLQEGSEFMRSRRRRRMAGVATASIVAVVVLFVVLPLGGRDEQPLNVATKPLPTAVPSAAIEATVTPGPIPLGSPSFVADGGAVYDLRLSDGGRFRLSLPESLADEFIVTEQPASAPVLIESPSTTVAVSFAYCEGRNDQTINPLGAGTTIDGRSLRVCRADELIVVDIETEVELAPQAAAHFDLRPIAFGSRYGLVRTALPPGLGSCDDCAPHGPMVFGDQNIVVNTTGRSKVTAVDLETLEELWTFDTTRFDTYLHGGPEGVFVGVEGASFTKLDPLTGGEIWRLGLESTDRDLAISGFRDGVWILLSSATGAGQHWPATIRRIDIETGEVDWTATGYKGMDWQGGRPVLIDGVLILAGITDFAAGEDGPRGGYFRGFDIETGETVWTTDVEITAPAFVPDALAALDFETGAALLARTSDQELIRIDPTNGTIMWRTGSVLGISGTDLAPDGALAIDAIGPRGAVLLDPRRGVPVIVPDALDPATEDFDPEVPCPITVPVGPAFIPPAPWPAAPNSPHLYWFGSDDLWTVLELGPDASQQRKSVWWSANFLGGGEEQSPAIRVTYERLDVPAETVVHESPGTNAITPDDGWFMINGITPSTPGCWQAIATYKRAQLRYVFEIE